MATPDPSAPALAEGERATGEALRAIPSLTELRHRYQQDAEYHALVHQMVAVTRIFGGPSASTDQMLHPAWVAMQHGARFAVQACRDDQ